jgi:hypothetical protein
MSCPAQWHSGELDPQTREHLATCPSCRRRAIAGDPLLAFVLQPRPRLAPDEAAMMQARVRASLRAHELETKVSTYAESQRRRLRYAAAAMVLAAAGSVALFDTAQPDLPMTAQLPAEWPGDEEALLRELATMPVLEARGVTTLRGDERTVVMEIGRLDV